MGKHLWTKTEENEEHEDDQSEEYHPGCMWGVFHSLDYHHWQYNIKKMLPHRKHDRGRRIKRNARTILDAHDCYEVQKLLDTHVNQTSGKTSTNKRSLKARIKALIAEEVSKEENHKRLGRTYSIHHMEPSDLDLGEITTEWESPTIDARGTYVLDYSEHNKPSEYHDLFPEKCDKPMKSSVNQKLGGNASDHQFEDDDILEIFKVNKELFLKILKNSDDDFSKCFNSLSSKSPGRLTKSGSFPVADLSRSRNFRPSKLKHKQNEIWSFPKGEKLLSDTRPPKLVASKSRKDLYTKSGPLNELNQEMYFSSLDSSQESDKPGSNEVVENLLHGIKGSLTHIIRSSSLKESMDRYTRLFDYSLGREPKLNVSKSLKLTNEHESRLGGHASKSSRRIRSLSNLDSYYSLHNEEISGSNLRGSHDEPKPEGIPTSAEIYVSPHAIEVTDVVGISDGRPRVENLASVTVSGNDEGIAESDGVVEEMEEVTVGERNSHQHQSHVSVLESCFQDGTLAEFPIPEDLECIRKSSDEKEASVDLQNRPDTDLPSWSCSKVYTENFENRNKSSIKNHIYTEDPDFNYVRAILELSGFIKNKYFGTWHTQDQPLNPSLFEEVESCWLKEQNIDDSCHHQLLFDLINDVLVRIYDISFTYYPRALSFSCRVRPMPVGYNVLEEVWSSVSRSMSSSPEPDVPLDDIVAQDLAKDDGWMNLQLETECLALELEDWIFEELLEEVICS